MAKPSRPDSNADLRMSLLNGWQRDFPLVPEPFGVIAEALGVSAEAVLHHYADLHDQGALSRIGAVFAPGAGGAALLAALAVPPERLDAVAAQVSAHPGVNHNYAREDRFNLWFVMTGRDRHAVDAAMDAIEAQTQLTALRLRMVRPYRIDLGFDLRHRTAGAPPSDGTPHHTPIAPFHGLDAELAALVEEGLPLVGRPYDRWAETLGVSTDQVLGRLRAWQGRGALRRFGAIVRHHELGWSANAMTVFDVPDEAVDRCGEALARASGITLAYRRERALAWPFNLYCMVHGTDRDAVHEVLARAIPACGLMNHPHQVLFSTRRYKQTGARRFRALPAECCAPSAPLAQPSEEACDAAT